MSLETSEWLNRYTLIGLTAQRGTAWHYRKSDQGDEPNHYEGFVPFEDVERRLFHWNPGERKVAVVLQGRRPEAVTTFFKDGSYWSVVEVPDRKAVTRDDTEDVLGVFKDGYEPHNYRDVLLHNVGQILSTSNNELGIGSAGLLRNGGQAWVQVQVPESIEVGGTDLLPYLTAATSLDGTMSTTYLVGADVVVCDNTLSAATVTAKNRIRLRHSRYSQLRLADAREELEILFTAAEDMIEAVDQLQNTPVTNQQFGAIRQLVVPRPEEGKNTTRWERKQEALIDLWRNDPRVAPWAGSAWGVLMAFNTYGQHVGTFRKTKQTGSRAEANMIKSIQGTLEANDREVLSAVEQVLAGV